MILKNYFSSLIHIFKSRNYTVVILSHQNHVTYFGLEQLTVTTQGLCLELIPRRICI